MTFTAIAQPLAISKITFIDADSNSVASGIIVREAGSTPVRLRVFDNAANERTGVAVSYFSGNPEVATVDAGGTVQGKRAGFSTLTVTGGGVAATAAITVVQVTPTAEVESFFAGNRFKVPEVKAIIRFQAARFLPRPRRRGLEAEIVQTAYLRKGQDESREQGRYSSVLRRECHDLQPSVARRFCKKGLSEGLTASCDSWRWRPK